jgi:hypothetical protein
MKRNLYVNICYVFIHTHCFNAFRFTFRRLNVRFRNWPVISDSSPRDGERRRENEKENGVVLRGTSYTLDEGEGEDVASIC